MNQTVTNLHLARIYAARNEANKRMSQALRTKDKTLIKLATEEATKWNQIYAATLRQYKKQQKKEHRDQLRTTMIKFYLDVMEQEQKLAA